MSFYINNNNPNKPGPICGNPMNGICEKVLIEVEKVFDACLQQSTDSGIVLTVSDFNPPNPTYPLTYISSESTPGVDPIVTNVVIDRIDCSPNYANVSATIVIPITVTYRDANGVLGTATASITVNKSVMLFVPQAAVSPIKVKVSAMFTSSIGAYTATNTFTVTGCLQIIMKIVACVDILVPSYGYPVIPPCQVAEVNACPGFLDIPLYPTASPTTNRCNG